MNQPTNPFAELAISILPEQTSGRLARMCDVDQRTAQRWMSGAIEPPDEIVALLHAQAAALQAYHPQQALVEVAARAHDAGVEIEVIASWIAAGYEDIVGRRIR